MNRIDRKFINWILESTVLVVAAVLIGLALDRLLNTRAQFLGLFLLAALVLKGWHLVSLYRRSSRAADEESKNAQQDGLKANEAPENANQEKDDSVER